MTSFDVASNICWTLIVGTPPIKLINGVNGLTQVHGLETRQAGAYTRPLFGSTSALSVG